MTLSEFYRRRRILVTGLSGFKGLWLASWLERLGAAVTGFALPPDESMERGWPALRRRFPCRYGDVGDLDAVRRVFCEMQPELVFHLAAQALVRHSYAHPVETFATNLMGTVHVLEASRQSSTVRSVVVVTSDKCYANREQQAAYGEDDPLGGYDPYSASKGCAELAAAAYRCSFGRPHGRVATARAGNVIGGGDCAADRLVPDLVRSIAARQPCRLRRSDAVRPWQHVLEALSGYLMLGHRLMEDPERFASAWNFGPDPDDTATVGEVARQFAACWGKGCLVETAREQGPHEANVLRLDSSKANRELAWQPLLTMPERIAWTVAWYRTWRRRPESVWRITARQIDAYEERIRQCPELLRLWWPASTASSARPSHAA